MTLLAGSESEPSGSTFQTQNLEHPVAAQVTVVAEGTTLTINVALHAVVNGTGSFKAMQFCLYENGSGGLKPGKQIAGTEVEKVETLKAGTISVTFTGHTLKTGEVLWIGWNPIPEGIPTRVEWKSGTSGRVCKVASAKKTLAEVTKETEWNTASELGPVQVWVAGEAEHSFTRAVADSIFISDSSTVQRQASRAVTDAAQVTDVATGAKSTTRAIADAANVTDNATRVQSQSRAFFEAGGSVTPQIAGRGVMGGGVMGASVLGGSYPHSSTVAASIGITEHLASVVQHAITDMVSVTDQASRLAQAPRALADTIQVTETVSRYVTYARAAADSLEIFDHAAGIPQQPRSVTDLVYVSDVVGFVNEYSVRELVSYAYSAPATPTYAASSPGINTYGVSV